MRRLTERVARELGVTKDELVGAKLNAAQLATGGVPIEASVDLRKGATRLWGWLFPGSQTGSQAQLQRDGDGCDEWACVGAHA